ncbi:MAG TPA: hypothetical protein VH092_37800 [Urbifossiella sp.]|nr:hypothetical protein [Urbifossiella sp.]
MTPLDLADPIHHLTGDLMDPTPTQIPTAPAVDSTTAPGPTSDPTPGPTVDPIDAAFAAVKSDELDTAAKTDVVTQTTAAAAAASQSAAAALSDRAAAVGKQNTDLDALKAALETRYRVS